MAPTRELALQIKNVITAIGLYLKVTVHASIGGTSMSDDIEAFRSGVQIVVGTPGRVLDMIERRYFKTDKVKMFIWMKLMKCYQVDLKNKFTTFSDYYQKPPKLSYYLPPCHKTFWKSPPNL